MESTSLHNVAEVLTRHAAQRPQAVALRCDGRSTTYAELDRASDRLAHALRRAGALPDARIAWLGKESAHYYALFFACAKARLVLVPVNWRLAAPEVEHILRDACAVLLFVEPGFVEAGERLRAVLPGLRRVVPIDTAADLAGGLQACTAGMPDTPVACDAGREDAVVQLYTSGTTGWPKGVVLAHRSFFAIREALAAERCDWLDWQADDVSLIGIPGFHVAGLWWAMQGFIAGVRNVVLRTFLGAEAVRRIAEEGVTTTLVVPAMMYLMLAESGADPRPFASLRRIAYGGSPITESLLRQSMAVFGCELAQLYGLTESGNAAICLPARDHLAGSPLLRAAGRPLPGVQVKVVDEHGQALAAGRIGEICLRTPAAMLGYWKNPEATAASLRDGWLHTGDAGRLDADGYLHVCDRLKDMVIVAGENVYPAEVENALCGHPAVAEAAVVGVPDARWGESVRAHVVLRAGQAATPRALTLFLRERLADFKIPTAYRFVAAIPRNPSGKILRRALRDVEAA